MEPIIARDAKNMLNNVPISTNLQPNSISICTNQREESAAEWLSRIYTADEKTNSRVIEDVVVSRRWSTSSRNEM